MANRKGTNAILDDAVDLTAAAISQGIAINPAGGLAVAGTLQLAGVTKYAGAIGDRAPVWILGAPVELRIKAAVSLAAGDPIILSSVAGQFDKLVVATGGIVFGYALEATAGVTEQYALCRFFFRGASVAAVP